MCASWCHPTTRTGDTGASPRDAKLAGLEAQGVWLGLQGRGSGPKPGALAKHRTLKVAQTPMPARSRAIEPELRTLGDILGDLADVRKRARERTWKGNPHPDYNAEIKTLELEATLLGFASRAADRSKAPTLELSKLTDEQLCELLVRAGVPEKSARKLLSGEVVLDA